MSASVLSICNEALAILGADRLPSLEDGSALAETCTTLASTTLHGVLTAYPWRWSLRHAALSRLALPPVLAHTYAFQMPPEALTLRAIFAGPEPGLPPIHRFTRIADQVHADDAALWAEYQVQVDIGHWPAPVRLVARYALAADLAVPVQNSTAAAQYWRGVAFGTPQEAGQGGKMREARNLDAQQQPLRAIMSFPLVEARLGGGA